MYVVCAAASVDFPHSTIRSFFDAVARRSWSFLAVIVRLLAGGVTCLHLHLPGQMFHTSTSSPARRSSPHLNSVGQDRQSLLAAEREEETILFRVYETVRRQRRCCCCCPRDTVETWSSGLRWTSEVFCGVAAAAAAAAFGWIIVTESVWSRCCELGSAAGRVRVAPRGRRESS